MGVLLPHNTLIVVERLVDQQPVQFVLVPGQFRGVDELLDVEETVVVVFVECLGIDGTVGGRAVNHLVLGAVDHSRLAAGTGRIEVANSHRSSSVSVMSGYTPFSSCTSRPVTGGLNTHIARTSVCA